MKPKSCDFQIIFEFYENKFFANTTLSKTFFMKDYETPIKTVGTPISWKHDFDLSKK